jgi:hypothetical protein
MTEECRFPVCPTIYRSHDYGQFKFLIKNRAINNPNVTKLVEENRKKFNLHNYPIIVTRRFQIIDGQHRFEASKIIKSPVYYIIDESNLGSAKDIMTVNRAGKNHSIVDKLDILFMDGDEGAIYIERIYSRFNGKFSKGVIFQLLATGIDTGSNKGKLDRNVSVTLLNKDDGMKVLKALYQNQIEDYNTAKMVMGLSYICKKTGIEPIAIIERVKKNYVKWVHPKGRQECVNSIINCYNFGLKSNRIVLQ